jgi:biotin synthase-related radical SAM superfamily protein
MLCGLSAKGQNDIKRASVEQTMESVSIALNYNTKFEVNLSGGTCGSPDSAIDYLAEICKGLKAKHADISISVECVPPNDLTKLDMLRAAGSTALIMNVEIYNDALRHEICPGRGAITFERSQTAIEYGVKIFDRGTVSSVVIEGLQPKDDVLSACREFIGIGVIPTLMPFKPLDGTQLERHELPDVDEYLYVSRESAKMMRKAQLGIMCNSGCAACGACSLEINLGGVQK